RLSHALRGEGWLEPAGARSRKGLCRDADGPGPAPHDGGGVRAPGRPAVTRPSRPAGALRARNISDSRAQGGKTLARPPPLPARHAPGRGAVSRPAGPVARLRPPPPRPDARADQRPAPRRDDGGRTDGRRSRPVPGGAVRVAALFAPASRDTSGLCLCLHTRRIRQTANAPTFVCLCVLCGIGYLSTR